MNSSGSFSYFFRKYPFLRGILFVVIIAVILFACIFVNKKTKAVPQIISIIPPVGSPGDIISIYGENFGDARDMNYVEISGSKLTASSYVFWTDKCIKVELPANVQNGLVYVGIKDLRSNPSLFANEADIPVPVPQVQQVTKPVITYLSQDKVNIGDVLVITGNNFGDSKNQSKVYFTVDYNNKINSAEFKNNKLYSESMFCANEDDFDYLLWSNTEIQVVVPDGVCTGVVIVDNGREKSEPKQITINNTAGYKTFDNKKIYLVEYSADIADVVTDDVSTITLRCPIPVTMVSQPNVEITEGNPQPIIHNYQNNLIHQISKNRNNTPKTVFTQTFVLPVYEVKTKVNADKIGSIENTNKNLLSKALRPDELVPSENENIVSLCKTIIGKEKNAWRQAKLIYNYMCDNYEIIATNTKIESDPLELLEKHQGDAYDFAVVYTALLRAAGIPSYTDAGILIGSDMMTQAHWWCEFYIPKVGWIPVDPALGAGLDYKKWTENESEDDREFYFGNMDSHHIAFSRGWSQLKPFAAENKIVQQPRSFALQSIWEEASEHTAKYSSYWGIPIIKGVY